jgi:pimeloyl-ACP methyl ester carboxylesterase
MSNDKFTAVLAHAAWFDASSWRPVIERLHSQEVRTVAVQIPLTSLAEDVVAVRHVLQRERGPVVLVGHSYGGAVITAAGARTSNVKALVYVAAIVPDENETVGDIFTRLPPHASAPKLAPDAAGFFWVTAEDFRNAIAPDAGASEAALLAAVQKPIAARCLGERLGAAAWREKPSYFLVAERDRMVAPETQHFLAARMKSVTKTMPCDHHPLASRADEIAQLVLAAGRSQP